MCGCRNCRLMNNTNYILYIRMLNDSYCDATFFTRLDRPVSRGNVVFTVTNVLPFPLYDNTGRALAVKVPGHSGGHSVSAGVI